MKLQTRKKKLLPSMASPPKLSHLPKTESKGMFVPTHPPPYEEGDEANLNCESGYVPPFDKFSTVVLDPNTQQLTWKPESIDCVPRSCMPPTLPEHGDVAPKQFVYPRFFKYVCDPGYVFNHPSKKYFCGVRGEWTPNLPKDARCVPVRCEPLATPRNGSVQLKGDGTYETEATFKCDRGFVLRGTATRVCGADGTWSGSEVTCERAACPPLDPSVRLLQDGPFIWLVDCGNGKTVTMKCLDSGKWSKEYPYCDNLVPVGSLATSSSNPGLDEKAVIPPVVPLVKPLAQDEKALGPPVAPPKKPLAQDEKVLGPPVPPPKKPLAQDKKALGPPVSPPKKPLAQDKKALGPPVPPPKKPKVVDEKAVIPPVPPPKKPKVVDEKVLGPDPSMPSPRKPLAPNEKKVDSTPSKKPPDEKALAPDPPIPSPKKPLAPDEKKVDSPPSKKPKVAASKPPPAGPTDSDLIVVWIILVLFLVTLSWLIGKISL